MSPAALALVNDDLGRRLMDEARGLLEELIGQAEARVNDRLKQLDDAVTLLMWSTIAGGILILVFTGGAAYTVISYTRELSRRGSEVEAPTPRSRSGSPSAPPRSAAPTRRSSASPISSATICARRWSTSWASPASSRPAAEPLQR